MVLAAVRTDESVRLAMALKFADTGFFIGKFLVLTKKMGLLLVHGVISLFYSTITISYRNILYQNPYAC